LKLYHPAIATMEAAQKGPQPGRAHN